MTPYVKRILAPLLLGPIGLLAACGAPRSGSQASQVEDITAMQATVNTSQTLNTSENANITVFQSGVHQSVSFNFMLLNSVTSPPFNTDANGNIVLTANGTVTCSFMVSGSLADSGSGQVGVGDGSNGTNVNINFTAGAVTSQQLNLSAQAASPVTVDITQDNSYSDASNACTGQIGVQDKANMIAAWVGAAEALMVLKPYHLGCLGSVCY